MPFADAQVSRTHLQSAIRGDATASTWAFSHPTEGAHRIFRPATSTYGHFSRPDAPTSPPIEAASSPAEDPLLEAAATRVYRQAVLEGEIIPRLHTEKGHDTIVRRWYDIPSHLPVEEQHEKLTAELIAQDEAIDYVTIWAEHHIPAHKGRSLPLPAPSPEPGRWQGAHLWVSGVLADRSVTEHPRLTRVGRQHLPFLLHAMASFSDHDTGHGITASNNTIGRKAAQLCTDHIAQGRQWSGRRTDKLSPVTLAGHVSALATALAEAGWLRERARGRHLNRLERAVAWLRTTLHQTKAASVRDLLVPDHARHQSAPAPCRPAWADPANPHMQKLILKDLWITTHKLVQMPVLHTHQHVVLLTYLVTLLEGYLTRARARETPPPKKKPTRKDPPRPSLAAQQLAAHLREIMPWLLRGPKSGKRRHLWSLARLLDELGLENVPDQEITARMERELKDRYWELHPATITHPLAWLRTVLANLWPAMDEGDSWPSPGNLPG